MSPSGVVVGSLFGPANVQQLDLMLAAPGSSDERWSGALVWIALGVVVLAVLVVALWPRSGTESVSAHTRRLASEFRCVDCEGLSVADSSTASARRGTP